MQNGGQKRIRVNVSHEPLYGETKTLTEWTEWLNRRFNEVPAEYRTHAIMEIDSEGGYEGEHHVETTVYYERIETPQEAQARRQKLRAEAEEAEQLSHRWKLSAERLKRLAEQ